MKRYNLAGFVFKSACFLFFFLILQFQNTFIFNFKHQRNKSWYFFEHGWGKFYFGQNFLRRESPIL